MKRKQQLFPLWKKMDLSLLPSEIVLYLASFLVYPDIVSLTKVCRWTWLILSPLRENLPWKITTARSSNGHLVVDIKVGWFNLSPDLPIINLFWKGQSRKKRRRLDIVTTKGVGGPFLKKILTTKDPYVEVNPDGSIKDIHSQPLEGSYPAYLRVGYLQPRYCSETRLLSLLDDNLPMK